MRHVRSVRYALVLAPAVWVLAGAGLTRDLTTRGRDDFAIESVTGLLLLVLAGAAYAILLLAPISAAGPLVGGLAFLGISAWVLASPAGYAAIWPESVAKEGFDLSRPGYGLAVLLALPLIGVAVNPRRWARPGLRRDSADPTEEMRLPVFSPVSDDTTTVLTPRPSEEPTLAGTARSATRSAEEKTAESPTPPLGVLASEPTQVLSADEPTVAVSADGPAAEATLAAPTRRDERRTVVVVSWDEVAAVAALGDGEASTEVARPAGTAASVRAGILAAADTTEDIHDETGDAVVVGRARAAPVVRPELAETRSLEAADPDRTLAIDLREATAERRVEAGDPHPARPTTVVETGDSDATRPITVAGPGDGEVTRPLEVPATMRLAPPTAPAPLAGHPGDVTAVIGRSIDEDETQVIRLDPERTQVIRPGSVEGPGERTEIVRLPVKDRAAIPAQRAPHREQPPEDDIPA